jgi:hypothetical protein
MEGPRCGVGKFLKAIARLFLVLWFRAGEVFAAPSALAENRTRKREGSARGSNLADNSGGTNPILKFEDIDTWSNIGDVCPESFTCAYCGHRVASHRGYTCGGAANQKTAYIRVCGYCKGPTFFARGGRRYPSNPPGDAIAHVPEEIESLYNEARLSAGAGAFTSAVLTCRKILMHIAVEKGAKENQAFAHYIEHLAAKGFLPPNGKGWVDHIRKKSNEANHDIVIMSDADAGELIKFTEFLLRFVYELPASVPKTP